MFPLVTARRLLQLAFLFCGALTPAGMLVEGEGPDGKAPAPIHGAAVEVRIKPKTLWPVGRELPSVVDKKVYVAWHERSQAAQWLSKPALYVAMRVEVPAGAQVSASPYRQVRGQRLEASDRDAITIDVPLSQIKGNRAELSIRFVDGTTSEISLEYGLAGDGAEDLGVVYALHRSCEALGVRIEELEEGRVPAFLLVRCAREGQTLHISLHKPLDYNFSSPQTAMTLLDVPGQRVLRVELPAKKQRKKTTITKVKLVDGKGRNAGSFLVSFGPLH